MNLAEKVILKKRIVSPDGSVLDPRSTPYSLGEIPSRYRTEDYIVYNAFTKEEVVVRGDQEIEFIGLKNNGLSRDIVLKPQAVVRSVEVKPVDDIPPLPIEESPIEEEKKVLIDINTASFEELTSIQGIGKTMANRIISERETKRFADCNELDERVKRPFKESWWNYSDKLCFS